MCFRFPKGVFLFLAILILCAEEINGEHESLCVRYPTEGDLTTGVSVGAGEYFKKRDNKNSAFEHGDKPEVFKNDDKLQIELYGIKLDGKWLRGWLKVIVELAPLDYSEQLSEPNGITTLTLVGEDENGRAIGEFVYYDKLAFKKKCNVDNDPYEYDLPGQYLPCRGIGSHEPLHSWVYHFHENMIGRNTKFSTTKTHFVTYWRFNQFYCNLVSKIRIRARSTSYNSYTNKWYSRRGSFKWIFLKDLLASDPVHHMKESAITKCEIIEVANSYPDFVAKVDSFLRPEYSKIPPYSIVCGNIKDNNYGAFVGRCNYKDFYSKNENSLTGLQWMPASPEEPLQCRPKDKDAATATTFQDYNEYVDKLLHGHIPKATSGIISHNGCCLEIPKIPPLPKVTTTTSTTTKKPTTTTTTTKKPTTTTTTTKKPTATTTTTKKPTTTTTTTKKPITTTTTTKKPTTTTTTTKKPTTTTTTTKKPTTTTTTTKKPITTTTTTKKPTTTTKKLTITTTTTKEGDEGTVNTNKGKGYIKEKRTLTKEEMEEEIRIGLNTEFPYANSIWNGRRSHAIFLIVITTFVIPISMFMSRYYKETFMKTRINFSHVWYFIHGLSVLVMVMFYMGGMYAVHQAKKYAGVSLSPDAVSHRLVGWLSIVIFLLMGIFGGIRPLGQFSRMICIGMHSVLGMVYYAMNLFLMMGSVFIPGSPAAVVDAVMVSATIVQDSSSETVLFICLGWISLEIIFLVIMSVHMWFMDRKVRLSASKKCTLGTVSPFDEMECNDFPGHVFRIAALCVYIFISLATTTVLCLNVSDRPMEGRGYGKMSCTHSPDGEKLLEHLDDYCKYAHMWWL